MQRRRRETDHGISPNHKNMNDATCYICSDKGKIKMHFPSRYIFFTFWHWCHLPLLSVYFQPSELELWVNFGIAILCFTVIMNSYGPPPLVHCTVRGRAGTGLAEQTNNFCWNNISFIFVLGNMEPRTCSKVIYDLAEMTPIINFPCISV